jgi:hypothetical protein
VSAEDRLRYLVEMILRRENELRRGSQTAAVSIICKAREFQHSTPPHPTRKGSN